MVNEKALNKQLDSSKMLPTIVVVYETTLHTVYIFTNYKNKNINN